MCNNRCFIAYRSRGGNELSVNDNLLIHILRTIEQGWSLHSALVARVSFNGGRSKNMMVSHYITVVFTHGELSSVPVTFSMLLFIVRVDCNTAV